MSQNPWAITAYVAATVAFLGLASYVALDVWLIGEDEPESFEAPVMEVPEPTEPDCYTESYWDEDAQEQVEYEVCADASQGETIVWEPWCISEWSVVEDEWGEYEQPIVYCYDYEGGEELCPAADGPYFDFEGYPYFDTHWEYCGHLGWSEGDDLTIAGFTVDQNILGTSATGSVPFIIKWGWTHVTGKHRLNKAMKKAVKAAMDANLRGE